LVRFINILDFALDNPIPKVRRSKLDKPNVDQIRSDTPDRVRQLKRIGKYAGK